MENQIIQSNKHDQYDQSEKLLPQMYKEQKSFDNFEAFLSREHNNFYLKDDLQREKDFCQYFKALFGQGEQKSFIEVKINFQQNEKQKDNTLDFNKNQPIQDISEKNKTLYQNFTEIKAKNLQKYQNIVSILQFLYYVKTKIKLMRFDFYSTKVFLALQNSCADDLSSFLHILKKVYLKIFKQQNQKSYQCKVLRKETNQTFSTSVSHISKQNQFQLKNRQFLLLIRFLISQQKILQFIQNQQIQEYYTFLIENICLGHYNNEANKKTPEKIQIQLIKELLSTQKGKQKFQKICAINHGNKLRRHNMKAYETLYKMSLNKLNEIHQKIKKKVSLAQIVQFINENQEWIHFENNSIQNIQEELNQRDNSSQQFLNKYEKVNKKVSVRHVGSLQLPQKQEHLNFNIRKVSSVQIDDIQQKDDEDQVCKQQKKVNQ